MLSISCAPGLSLGPSLFLVYYVNDIGTDLEFSKIWLFADDAFLYAPVNSHSDVHCFQKDLDDVLDKWAQQLKVVFNVEKRQVVNFAGSTMQLYSIIS